MPNTPPLSAGHRPRGPQRLFALGLLLALAAPSFAAEVWVITDRQHPIQAPPGARLIELDAPARFESELAANVPADAARATTIIQQRLQEGGAPLQRRMASAYQGVTDAWSLGISKIPAVVVDQRYVVYGEPDVARALARIAQHRSTRP